ncbi:U3 small nucleolar RNA-associated protein 11 [[Candida] jaroonii]|uniref:U3 small nucleolar RNA-associated protein 11 n=1 Tax=[Candida] jaroonii TaxID=467808 RepID=A0ACA9Y5F8_9ASCO|nr:U3 small nucleolar RNA-associated protein 11 [[Candida] jaroonii]
MAKLVHNVQKKQHRERSQTADRAKFGLLEKKKDYKLRANDYHKKQAALKILRNKASQYNPDEYYHAMTRKRTDDKGILIADRGNDSLTTDQVKLLKTQDSNYVRTMRINELKKIEKQKGNLGFKATGKHTVFVDSKKEQEEFDPEEYFGVDEDLLQRRENRLRLEQLESNKKIVVNELDEIQKERLLEKKAKQFSNLKKRLERESQLKGVEERMEQQKELMKKGNKKKIVDGKGNVHFKWKNQRKR